MAETFLELDQVYKNIGDLELLKNINLSITQGETVGIFGPSGSGKTTLLQLIGCLDSKSSGRIKIKGIEICDDELIFHRRHTFGFIFQNFQLLQHSSVLTNVLLPIAIQNLPHKKRSEKEAFALEILKKVRLEEKIDQNVNTLSGGEKQRVAIARALITDPSCILADEPTGSLDEETKEEIFSLLLSLAKEKNKSLIMVTHDRSFMKAFVSNYQLKMKTIEKIV
jgi:lipoprotein-releasing system ATP-binding protein